LVIDWASHGLLGRQRRSTMPSSVGGLTANGPRTTPDSHAEIRLLSVDPGQAGAIVRIITQFFCPFDRW